MLTQPCQRASWPGRISRHGSHKVLAVLGQEIETCSLKPKYLSPFVSEKRSTASPAFTLPKFPVLTGIIFRVVTHERGDPRVMG